jgi:hypothetical protein
MLVVHRGRRRAYRVDDNLLAIDADMRLGSEVVLVLFLVRCIWGSRSLLLLLVDDGAAMMVASIRRRGCR